MKKLRLSLLMIVLCLLGSKSQAKEVVFDGNGTLTITLDKDECSVLFILTCIYMIIRVN